MIVNSSGRAELGAGLETGDSGWLRGVKKWWGMEGEGKNRGGTLSQGVQYVYTHTHTWTTLLTDSTGWDLLTDNNTLMRQNRKSVIVKVWCHFLLLHNDASFGGSGKWHGTEKGSNTDRYPGSAFDGHVYTWWVRVAHLYAMCSTLLLWLSVCSSQYVWACKASINVSLEDATTWASCL